MNNKKNKIEISTIRKLKEENKSDDQIMKQLGLPLRTYNKYKSQLQESERKELQDIILEESAYELLQYMNSLHETINMAREVSKTGTSFERLDAERMKLYCHSELIKLMSNGPAILANVQVGPALQKVFKDIKKKGEEVVDVTVEHVDEDKENGSRGNKKG